MIARFYTCLILVCASLFFVPAIDAVGATGSKPKKGKSEGCWEKGSDGEILHCYCHYEHQFNFFDYEVWKRWCRPCGTSFCNGKLLGGACRKEDHCTEH